MTTNKILIVDDEKPIRFVFSEYLKKTGFIPLEASNGRQAAEVFQKESPSAVILDMNMPGMNGIETMQELKKIDPDVPIIIVTAYGDIPTAVDAIKLGAYDFLSKPPDFDRLLLMLKKAVERLELEKAVKRLNNGVEMSLEWMLGKSESMKSVIKQVRQVAWSDFSIIIQGETGTGKSFVANVIHNMSKRANGPFITVDIGAIPETLIESELFGHEKGAFTGADKKKHGFFEAANKGTLLIDELQNMSLYVQSKLLKTVEEKKLFSLGTTRPTEVDVRIVGATNTDIKKAVKEGTFREDLFFRLGEFMITIPPLRDRVEDILFFAQKFYRDTCEELGKPVKEITDEAIALLKSYSWPGNIRELKNVMRRSVLLSEDGIIKREHIDFLSDAMHEDKDLLSQLKEQGLTLRAAERIAIKHALQLAHGNKTKASASLQIDYKTLLKKIKEYGLAF